MSTTSSHEAVEGSGYSDLGRALRARGLLRPRSGYYVLLVSVLLGSLAAVVLTMTALRDTWWVLLLAPPFAVVSTQLAFFSHDAAHRQVVRRRRTAEGICLVFGDLLNGLSYGWWIAKHNAHHAHPNDLAHDPDVTAGAFVFDDGQAATRSGFAGWMTRHQAALFFPLLTLEAFNLRISSVRAVIRPGVRHRGREAALLLGHALLYLGLLAATMTWEQALAFLFLHQALFGVYLGSSFAPSHKGMPVLSEGDASDPLLRQVLTSRNVRGGPWVDLALGGLNLQIEHHLFPSMPRPNLRRAHPVVLEHCRARGISFQEISLFGAYGAALRHLHDVGAPLRTQD
jgi:fatty acid desaturase